MNTKITYLYRDASNYKVLNEATVRGLISVAQIDIILGCLKDGEYFIPGQVGLPERRFCKLTEDDHCWFELQKCGFEATKRAPDVDMPVEELVGRFLKAKGDWKAVEVKV